MTPTSSNRVRVIESWFHDHEDGEFVVAASDHRSSVVGSSSAARTVIYTTKVHCLDHNLHALDVAHPVMIVGRYGLPVSPDLIVTFDFNDQLRRRIYRVERGVTLRLTDLAKLDAMLSDLLGVGNLKIEGVEFVTSKSAQHESEARSQAVANAKEKAKHMAELNGLKLGKARNIQILTEHQRPFVSSVVPVVGSAGARSPRRQAVSPASPSSSADPFSSAGSLPFGPVAFRAADEETQEQRTGKPEEQPFALGTIELTTSVSIVFDMAE